MRSLFKSLVFGAMLLCTYNVFGQLTKTMGPEVTRLTGAYYIPGTDVVLVLGDDDSDLAKRGVYRSEDDGETFTQVLQSNYPLTIYQNGADIYHISAVTDAWHSDDEGETWTLMDPLPTGTVGDFEIASNGDMYSVVNGKVYASMDAGANWSLSNTGIPSTDYIQDIEVLKAIADVFVVQTYDGVYASNDGASWSAATGLPSGATYQSIFTIYLTNYLLQQAVGCTDAMVVVTQDGEVYTSVDGFNYTYVNTIPGLGVLSAYLVSIDPLQQGRVYAIVDQGTGQLLFQWDFCKPEWEQNTEGWLDEGVGGSGGSSGTFFNPVLTNPYAFKTAADTSVGILMTGFKVENGDTFRIFRTNTTLSDAVGIGQIDKELESISVYPTVVANDADLIVHNSSATKIAGLILTDLSGREIARWENVVLNEGANTLNLPTGMGTGHYLVRVTDLQTGSVGNRRFIIGSF